MKLLMVLLMLIVSSSIWAEVSISLAPINFQVSADNALLKFDQAFLAPERLLERFQPVGAGISNKHVTHNEISFVVTKKVLIFSKSVLVDGVLETSENNLACNKDEVGYSLNMNLDHSDNLVTNNIERLEATFCLHSQTDTVLIGNVNSKIIIGNNYSKTLGPIAINLIKEQISPLLLALTEEIQSMR